MVHYLTYGTLQSGFQNHDAFADLLGRPLGLYRTAEAFPLVVPLRAACPNPGCRFDHRIPALLDEPGSGQSVVGEVYHIADEVLEQLDRLEAAYHRRAVAVEPVNRDGETLEAQVYVIADSTPYRELIERNAAEVVSRYTLAMADGELKGCCRVDPAHPGPHDVSSPF